MTMNHDKKNSFIITPRESQELRLVNSFSDVFVELPPELFGLIALYLSNDYSSLLSLELVGRNTRDGMERMWEKLFKDQQESTKFMALELFISPTEYLNQMMDRRVESPYKISLLYHHYMNRLLKQFCEYDIPNFVYCFRYSVGIDNEIIENSLIPLRRYMKEVARSRFYSMRKPIDILTEKTRLKIKRKRWEYFKKKPDEFLKLYHRQIYTICFILVVLSPIIAIGSLGMIVVGSIAFQHASITSLAIPLIVIGSLILILSLCTLIISTRHICLHSN